MEERGAARRAPLGVHPDARVVSHLHLSQGQTLRKGVTIDCARDEDAGRTGKADDQGWLHLYVMFSRATCMRNMLILRPPPREFLERGPPASLREALRTFDETYATSRTEAEQLAEELGFVLPPV